MGPFEMVAIIVVATCAASVARRWLKSRDAEPDPEQQRRIEQLEERVRHLEAVVTDPDSHLREKFKELEAADAASR